LTFALELLIGGYGLAHWRSERFRFTRGWLISLYASLLRVIIQSCCSFGVVTPSVMMIVVRVTLFLCLAMMVALQVNYHPTLLTNSSSSLNLLMSACSMYAVGVYL
jgi:hypothetical protein